MKQTGFTLIELMVAVSIIGVVLLAVTQMLVQSLIGAAKAEAITRVKNNGDSALIAMGRAIREGQNLILTPAGQFNCEANSGKSKLKFQDTNGDEVRIEEQSNRLQITDAAGSRFITGSEVEVTPNSLKFYCQDEPDGRRDKVRIEFTLAYSGGARASRMVSTNFYTSVMMRNTIEN